MPGRRTLVVVVVAAVAVAGGSVLALSGGPGADSDGGDLPDVTLTDFDGEQATLDEFSGDPLVVNFYASWCPPCIGEMRDAFGPVDRDLDGVTFVGVALQDDPEAALGVAEQTGVAYALVQDPEGELYRAFELAAMPATVYVDAEGQVRGSHNGALTRSQLEDQIATHLGEP